MNKKAEMEGLGTILIVFVGILVALLLYQAIGPFIGDATGANKVTVVNESHDAALQNVNVELVGQELVGTPVFSNKSGGEILASGNYTIREGIKTDGIKGIIYYINAGSTYNTTALNVSYEYYPTGYIDDAGGRGIALLIPILAALAIAIIALTPTLRSGVLSSMNK